MKCLGTIVVCLAIGWVLSPDARAENTVSSENPYGCIVERNVFGLNPPPSPASEQPPGDLPPKITPNGIMTIFGELQVLFKVTNVTPGQPAKETYYTLASGQSEDDIEVTYIDEPGRTVTFNNHGIVQQIPLANTPAKPPTDENTAPH